MLTNEMETRRYFEELLERQRTKARHMLSYYLEKREELTKAYEDLSADEEEGEASAESQG